MRTTIHIMRVKRGLEHHGIAEVRRDRDGDIFGRVDETILERIDLGYEIRDTAFILEYEGELYEAGREITLTDEEIEEAERELSKLEKSVFKTILSPITTLRPDAFHHSNQGGVRDLA